MLIKDEIKKEVIRARESRPQECANCAKSTSSINSGQKPRKKNKQKISKMTYDNRNSVTTVSANE